MIRLFFKVLVIAIEILFLTSVVGILIGWLVAWIKKWYRFFDKKLKNLTNK